MLSMLYYETIFVAHVSECSHFVPYNLISFDKEYIENRSISRGNQWMEELKEQKKILMYNHCAIRRIKRIITDSFI